MRRDFSEALGSVGKDAAQGSITFSVSFTPVSSHLLQHGALHVFLQSANGLLSADSNGLSDPFVKVTLSLSLSLTR